MARVGVSLLLSVAGLALGAAAYAQSQQRPQLYVRPRPYVFGLLFNSHSQLFANNPALERAINYALDRPALVRAWGPHAGQPTSRLIPPGVPGYGARSPYPVDGPDLAMARQLADGNLRGGKAVVALSGSTSSPLAQELKWELAAIGLDVNVASNRVCCTEPDMSIGGAIATYPDGLHVLEPFASSDQLAGVAGLSGLARRAALGQLDYDLMTLAPPFAPFMAANAPVFLSGRTHCFHWNPYYGADLSALCVR